MKAPDPARELREIDVLEAMHRRLTERARILRSRAEVMSTGSWPAGMPETRPRPLSVEEHIARVQEAEAEARLAWEDVAASKIEIQRAKDRYAAALRGEAIYSQHDADQRPQEARGLYEHQIRTTVAELRQQLDRAPTRVEAASALRTSESTLRRAMDDLGMGPWPPAPPKIERN